jgi:hypothetical protein
MMMMMTMITLDLDDVFQCCDGCCCSKGGLTSLGKGGMDDLSIGGLVIRQLYASAAFLSQ